MQRGVISSPLSSSEIKLLSRGRIAHWSRPDIYHRQMPKARRFAMHARASTDKDLLPRLSQQERLFSNLDGSMKHEAGSLYGSVALIAGALRLARRFMSWPMMLVDGLMYRDTLMHRVPHISEFEKLPCADKAVKFLFLFHRHHGGSWHPSTAIYHTGFWLHTVVCLPLWNVCFQYSYWSTAGRGKCQSHVRAGKGKTISALAPRGLR